MHEGLQKVIDYRILFLDMNSFFASVEQQYRPELRGKPVAVASHDAPKGTVLAASYEAKAFGVYTGMKLRDARAACRELRVVETEQVRYRAVHDRFMAILTDLCGPEVTAHSIDEASVRLPPNWQNEAFTRDLALRIKERFSRELGPAIRCSIGIAPNTFLAKVASNLQKPDGLTFITAANLEGTFAGMKLTDFPGIAERNAAALEARGIHTPLDFFGQSASSLRGWMGISGNYWWWRLHGHEMEPDRLKPHQSISHEHVLGTWMHRRSELHPVTLRMADRLIARLRRNRYQCRTLWISLRTAGGPGWSAERRFDSPSGTYFHLLHAFEELLAPLPETFTLPIRKIALGFGDLSEAHRGVQLDIFDTKPRDERITTALDLIRQRHGREAIGLGTTAGLGGNVAKEQLGFGRLKDRDGRVAGGTSRH